MIELHAGGSDCAKRFTTTIYNSFPFFIYTHIHKQNAIVREVAWRSCELYFTCNHQLAWKGKSRDLRQ